MSYLRGPLTRAQIRTLMEPRRQAGAQAPAAAAAPPVEPQEQTRERPVVPGDVEQLFLPGDGPAGAPRVYRPVLAGVADLHFARSRLGVDAWQPCVLLAPLRDDTLRDVWAHSERLPEEPDWSTQAGAEAGFAVLPAAAARAKSYAAWERALKTHLYREHTLEMWRSKPLKLISRVGETEAEFMVRVREALRERRDLQLAKLQKSYAPKLKRLQTKIQRAEEKLSREESQYSGQKLQAAISVGATLLGALFGRKAASLGSVGRATTAMRGAGRAAREKEDVERARRGLEKTRQELAALEEEFQKELGQIRDAVAAEPPAPETIAIRPRKSDIAVRRVALVWML
jgi:hypothetical protein